MSPCAIYLRWAPSSVVVDHWIGRPGSFFASLAHCVVGRFVDAAGAGEQAAVSQQGYEISQEVSRSFQGPVQHGKSETDATAAEQGHLNSRATLNVSTAWAVRLVRMWPGQQVTNLLLWVADLAASLALGTGSRVKLH